LAFAAPCCYSFVMPTDVYRKVPRFSLRLGITVGTILSVIAAAGILISGAAADAGAANPKTGPVDVLSAGSLQELMQTQIGPAFQKATGYTLNNVSMGSTALASSITGGTLQGDVFISASPAVNASLEGAANGNWVSWYDEFASSPLVLGYNETSAFAHALETEPWYSVVSKPGFLIGRTDPTTDPKGVLADEALDQAAKAHHIPGLRVLGTETSDVFAETSLVGELQAGQLDAGFFYGVEAAAANIKTVPLTGTSLAGDYTITILNKAPHEAAAVAFVNFLLGKGGKKILAKNGVVAMKPTVIGLKNAPTGVKAALRK
jgi:molybdate/tungstate transport system substrate-binding protein